MTPALPAAFLARPIAHRGLHDRAAGIPENSLAAVRAAVAAGYGIEIDLQPSADGVPMVFHDADLARLAGEVGPIAARPRAALAALRLLGTPEPIPTFAEVLALVAGRVPLLVEVKDQSHALGPVDGALERAAAEAARGYEGPLAFMSFNPHSVLALRDAAPDVPRGIVACAYDDDEWAPADADRRARLRAVADFDEARAAFVSHDKADLANPAIAALKARGVPVLTWTIRSPEEERAARAVADAITFEGYRP